MPKIDPATVQFHGFDADNPARYVVVGEGEDQGHLAQWVNPSNAEHGVFSGDHSTGYFQLYDGDLADYKHVVEEPA